MTCERSTPIALAIHRTDQACIDLARNVEIASAQNNAEALAQWRDTLSNHQEAAVKLRKDLKEHQATCELCRAA
jgi:hypothetical protein